MVDLVLSFIGSLCPGILLNVKKESLLWVGLSGTLGWLAFSAANQITGEVILPTFAGAVAVGLYSEIMARVLKSPATVFSVPGIFPLVPGIAAYNTVQFLVENKLTEAAAKAMETITIAGAIAFGIMLMSALFRFARKSNEKYSRAGGR
jgi:uncharacterized membrane protein YjjB (DUF3815 family)